jgi:hypothetical protein
MENAMRLVTLFVLLFCTALSAARGNEADLGTPLLFTVPLDGRIAIEIDRQPVSLYSAPGMPNVLSISKAFATRSFGIEIANMRGDDRKIRQRIGPVEVAGRARQALVSGPGMSGAGGQIVTDVSWFETDTYDFADALAGPYALPYPVVRYQLQLPKPGEVEFSLPLAPSSRWWIAATPLNVGKQTVYLAFAPHFKTSVASAGAGAVISALHDGQFSGSPSPVIISHNVQRPARRVLFGQPLRLGGLSLPSLLVRTRDYGSSGSIFDPAEASGATAAKGDSILVKAKRTSSRPIYVVYVGADALSGCSSITYNKPAQTITLSCLPVNT